LLELFYRSSWVSPSSVTPWAGEWKLECEHGEISFTSRDNHAPDTVKIRKFGKRERKLELPNLEFVGRVGSLNAFVESIRTGTEPTTSGRDNIKSLQLSLESIRSAQEKRVIRLNR
jgi:predicted dehydrogenase